MPTVGEQLRTAREAQKLQIQAVAAATNMRTDHVIALEEGNYAPFPAPVYIRGSIRTYAKLLKLDVVKIMDDLSREMDQQPSFAESSSSPSRRRGVLDFISLQLARFGWKRSLLLAIVIVIIVVFLIRSSGAGSTAADPLADLPPPAYQPPRTTDGGYLPLPDTNR